MLGHLSQDQKYSIHNEHSGDKQVEPIRSNTFVKSQRRKHCSSPAYKSSYVLITSDTFNS